MSNKSKTTVAPGIELPKSDIENAREDGARDALREGGRAAVLADTGTTGDAEDAAEAQRMRVSPALNSTVIAPLLNLSLDTLVERLTNDKVQGHIDFETAKGLLDLERSGQNRTSYVQAIMKRLGIKDPREVTHAGPSYTRDVSNLSHLGGR